MTTASAQIPRLRFVDKAYLVVLALFVITSFFLELGLLGVLAGLSLFLTGLVLGIRYFKVFGRHLLWPLRNRLRVTYMFIGVVPILLILLLVFVAVYILTGQISSFLLTSELQLRGTLLRGPTELVASSPASEKEALIRRIFPFFSQQYPGLEICARNADQSWAYPQEGACEHPPEGWQRASGLVSRDSRLFIWVHTRTAESEVTTLMPLSRSFVNGLLPGLLDAELVGRIDDLPGTSPEGGPEPGALASASLPYYRFANEAGGAQRFAGSEEAIPKANMLDFNVTWPTTITVAEWSEPGSSLRAFLSFNTRPSAVWEVLSRRDFRLGGSVDFSQSAAVGIFLTASALFLIVEAFSALAGMRLSRSITQAVENLYEGTQFVMRGEFRHRVQVKGEDQLADLGRSFNRMTENLESLVAISKEKERMQSELEIAREVQSGLYPKDPPKFENIELVAMSQPARMASGDYFDYLRLEDNRVAFAIGDVAGKGISAALLMASIQSTMRAQLRPFLPPPRGAAETWLPPQEALSTALMVSRLNQQIHQFTSASKYATFFFGVYNDLDGELRYTNAGHLPPLLMRNGKISRLNVDGLVVGAFAFASYEESVLKLENGDVLLLYTDGISEPENEYGEEFGEDRLHALLLSHAGKDARDLADIIVQAVRDWVGEAEQFDDITLLIVRKL